MLKFVSTKPPRGKHEIHPDFHRQARGHFRLKAQSDTQTGLHTFDGENSLSFDSDGREKNEHNRSLLMTTNDEYDNLPHDKKFPMHTSSVSSALQSNLDTHVSRSRTPSASSQDSSRSLLRHHDMYAGKRSGTFRHVTWSPEVINGVQSNHPLAEQNLNKPTSNASEKKQTFAKAGKKSLQGISRFLLGDPARRHKRSRSTDIEMDNLHKGSVEDSHSLISDYLQSSQSKSADDHVTSIPSNQNEDTRSQFLKSHEETSHEKSQKPKPHSPWSLHKVIHHFQTKIDQGKSNQSTVKAESHDISKDDKDYYDNSTDISQNSKVIVDHQSKPPTHHLPKDFKRNGDFVFAPISFSTPKKKDLFVLDDSNEKNRKTKEKRDSGDVISVGTTWDQRPFSSDYEEIKVANENSLPHLKANQITKSSSNLQSDWMIGNQAIEIPSKKRQKRNYPRLNLTSFRDVPSQFDIVRPVSAPKSLSGQHHTEKLYSKIQKSPERKLEQSEVLNDAIQSNMTSQKVSKHVEDTHRRKNLSPQPVGIQGNVMTSCVPQINHDMNKNESVRRYHVTREIPMSTSQSQHSVMNSSLHDMINRSHDHKMESDQVELDLVYITERIISMSFPSDEHEATYQYNLKGVMNMLRGKHGENILILNFSEPRNDLQKENNQRVIDYGWPDHLAPPLERLCNICKSIDSWLNSDPSHVIVLHSKGGRGRLAVVIAAFMHYSSICASADQAMDRMAMKRFYDDKLGGVMYPSHKRYVQYFSGLLSGSIKINSQALYLHHLVIHGVPNFDAHGGCRPFIKVYQGMQPIFTSGVYNVTDQMQKVCISISPGIPLRGDIMIKCYHKKSQSGQREPIWRCQFHTCAISHYNLLFGKKELDDALYDPRFPDIGKVEFVFGPNQDANVQVSDFKSDVTVPVDDNTDGLVRWDSYESFSHIDGVPTHNGILGNTTTSPSSMSPPYSSYNTETRQYNSSQHGSNYSTASTRQTVPPLDEQTQLDNILSDLLNDQVFVSPKSGSNTLSKETRTFRTFETQKGPDGKLSHQTAEVTYKLPGEVKEERSYTMKTEKEMKSYAPTHAFSYTPTSPELARRVESPKTTTLPYRTDYDNRFHSESSYNYNTMDNSRSMSDSDSSWLLQQQRKLREKKDVKDEKRVEQEKKLVEELRTAQNRYMTKRAKSEEEERDVMDSYHMNGLSAPPTGGYNYSMSRTHTYSKDSKSPNSSGDTSFDSKPVRPPPSPTQTRITIHSNTSTSAPISPPIRSSSKDYMSRSRTQSGGQTMQGSHTFTRQHSDVSYDRKNQIAPPVIRQITITTPPTTPRPFSPSYQTSTYIYSNKKTDSQPSPKVERKTQYQEMKPQEVTSSQSSWKQSSSQSYSTGSLPRHEPTKSKVTEIHESDIPLGQKKSHYITEVYVHRGPQTDSTTGTLEQNRTQKTEKVEHDTNRLTELERSLQAASNSIIASQPSQSWQQQKSTNQGFTQEHVVTRRVETRKYETHQQQQQQPQVIQPPISPPKQLRTVEEDRFSLRPIGPGVTPLEPEGGVGTGTLNRATTPSFPVSPVASAAGGTTRVVDVQRSPSQPQQFSNTQQHQQQYRYEYQNQYNTNQQQNQFNPQQQQQFNQQQNQINNQQNQQFNQHQMTQQFNQQPLQFNQQHEYTKQQRTYTQQQYNQQQEGGGTLHVDTSPKMLSPGTASSTMTRSPSSPHSPDTLNSLRQQLNVAHTMSTGAVSPVSHSVTGQSSPSVYFGLSRRGSISSLAESVDATHTTPRFVKDTSKYWYKPHISREEAIQLLKDKSPGTFIVRDSNSFPGAFGLALKVATIPPNVQTKSSGDPAADLVRHFLIEPTPKGVRLRGCSNEPVFGSLASLVYQHSITPLALPCKLALPEIDTTTESSTMDSSMTSEIPSSAAALLAQGAACNVFYLNSVDTESLTGPQAVSKAIKQTLDQAQNVKQTVVHFKVSNQGITLTDNQRKLFFRRHYPVSAVTFCGMDPEGRKWLRSTDVPGVNVEARIFGFVARKQGGVSDNACHLFAELDPEQPASAIVNFVTKIMIGQGKVKP